MAVAKPHCKIAADEITVHKTSIFHDKNNDQTEPMCVQIHKGKYSVITLKYFRCDNAGENIS